MKNRNFYNFDLFPSLLSVFDISGFLPIEERKPISRGIEYDFEQLSRDQRFLIEDYKNACERVKDEINQMYQKDECQRH